MRTHNDEDHGFTVRDAEWVHGHGVAGTIAEIERVIGDRRAYLTFEPFGAGFAA